MKYITAIAAVSALVFGVSAATIPTDHVFDPCGGTCPLISYFSVYGHSDCHAEDYVASLHYFKGQDSDICHPFTVATSNSVYSVSETYGNLKCQREPHILSIVTRIKLLT